MRSAVAMDEHGAVHVELSPFWSTAKGVICFSRVRSRKNHSDGKIGFTIPVPLPHASACTMLAIDLELVLRDHHHTAGCQTSENVAHFASLTPSWRNAYESHCSASKWFPLMHNALICIF